MRGSESKWGREMDGGRGFELLLLAASINPGLYQRCSMLSLCRPGWEAGRGRDGRVLALERGSRELSCDKV